MLQRQRKYGTAKLAGAKVKKEKIKKAKKIKTLRAKKEKELLKQHIRAKQLAAQLTLLAREMQTVTKNIQRLHQETKN